MKYSVRQVAGPGLLTALVIILQFMGSFIHIGIFSISLVLIPIVVGASLYSVKAGMWLGFVFGVIVLLSGDATVFMAINAPGAIFTVLIKGILAGLGAGIIYKLLQKKTDNNLLPIICAAITCPIINTGIFLLGCRIFFLDTIAGWASTAGFDDLGTYFIFGLVGANFVVELLINVVLSPIIVRIVKIGRKTI